MCSEVQGWWGTAFIRIRFRNIWTQQNRLFIIWQQGLAQFVAPAASMGNFLLPLQLSEAVTTVLPRNCCSYGHLMLFLFYETVVSVASDLLAVAFRNMNFFFLFFFNIHLVFFHHHQQLLLPWIEPVLSPISSAAVNGLCFISHISILYTY